MSDATWQGRRLHFVGIGGAGMSGLALVARTLGAAVTGSDSADGHHVCRLRVAGIEPVVGHAAANVPDGAELVYSSAVKPDNPERERGRELGLRELRRGELLGELSALRPCVAVAGTHGKTTTAAMAVHALQAAGQRPGYVIGAELHATGSNADWGEGPWLVVESDESDRTFLALDADVAVVTNVELEHLDEYGSREEVDDAFRTFLARAREAVIWDRPDLLALRDGPAVPFDAADPELEPGASTFAWRGHRVRVGVPGEHNARNAAAALEACRLAGADPGLAAAALAGFPGTARRFELLGASAAGAQVYDDYAHHPTEVRATLEAARTLAPRRLVAVLQPHGYTRVAAMAGGFGEALRLADHAVVVGIYSRRGRPEDFPGVSIERIVDAAGDGTACIERLDAAETYLSEALRAGDLCVVLGSGDVGTLARRLVTTAPPGAGSA